MASSIAGDGFVTVSLITFTIILVRIEALLAEIKESQSNVLRELLYKTKYLDNNYLNIFIIFNVC